MYPAPIQFETRRNELALQYPARVVRSRKPVLPRVRQRFRPWAQSAG